MFEKFFKKTGNSTDSVETGMNLKSAILNELDALYLDKTDATKSKHLLIWIDVDTLTFNSFDGFDKELADYISTERGYEFASIALRQGKPDSEGECRKAEVANGAAKTEIYLQEKRENAAVEYIIKKACVTIFDGKGSMLKKKYELSSDDLRKESRKFYNIGRGESPVMEGGAYRHNQIAIDDQNNLDTNRYVSRAHAHIGYSDTIGFYLQVERGGSRLSGSRTRIIRDEQIIEVENTNVKEPLRNGDLIELGKAVVLKFSESENKI